MTEWPWVCPSCAAPLTKFVDQLSCRQCSRSHPILRGIPRFSPRQSYATNFGLEWLQHAETQLDSATGLSLSRERFFTSTGWPEQLHAATVLEVGCGAGRFTEILLEAGAHVTSVDLSIAVEANWLNNSGFPHFHLAQADLYNLPLLRESFDYVVSLGVLQHTPDPTRAFQMLVDQLRPGGRLCVDVYPARLRTYLHWRYLLRPITKRLPPSLLYRLVEAVVPALLKVSQPVGRVPSIGPHLQRLLPVADYSRLLPLPSELLREWAILDTFDWLSPAYDSPQSLSKLRQWADLPGLDDVEILDRGFYVLRARKHHPQAGFRPRYDMTGDSCSQSGR